ncbi:hypothetical protein SMC26_25825 [Actinomadura fulvescens]|uniref:Alpha-2,8-polysialyltransferase family protein n=1 Tax=Actinomadura fulvescens TaxID=46160 RepID=A0ABN3QEJ4_9ACTN
MTGLFTARTASGLFALCAAVDAGLLTGAPRRILVLARTGEIPEQEPALDELPGFATLASRFDEVIDWSAEIAPLHPGAWAPPRDEQPLLARLLRRSWGLGAAPVELVTDSITEGPARALASIFHDAPLTVCEPGLAAYGPTMGALPGGVGSRVAGLLHLDLVEGLRPLFLAEYAPPVTAIPASSFRKTVAEVADAADEPAVPEVLRLDDVEADGTTPPEVLFARSTPSLVTGSSSALLTAARLYDLPVAATGVARRLEELPRYDHPDRIPLAILHATLPELTSDGELRAPAAVSGDRLASLVTAIAYCMRATVHAERREEARAFLEEIADGPMARYFSRSRLDELRLVPRPLVPEPAPAPDPPLDQRRRRGIRLRRRTVP